MTIATTGNATDFGDFNYNTLGSASASSSTRSVTAIGASGGASGINVMEYVTIASTGNAADFGDLTVARGQLSALSNGHGGLG